MLLDADVLIDLERKLPAADVWLNGLPALPFVSGFAAMEVLNGCRNRPRTSACRKVFTPVLHRLTEGSRHESRAA